MRFLFFDSTKVLILLVLTFIAVYFLPPLLSKVILLIFIPLIYKSKNLYIWFAFFLILQEFPGGFFYGGSLESAYRIPIYSPISGISFTLTELFLLVIFIKYWNSKKFIEPLAHIKKNLNYIFILFLILFLISPIIGTDFNSFKFSFKTLIHITSFYSFFIVFQNKETIYKFFICLMPFAILALLFQIYTIANNAVPASLFDSSNEFNRTLLNRYGLDAFFIRAIELPHVIFINFISTIFLILDNETKNKNYFWLINLICFISILLTGTRAWISSFILGYLLFFIFKSSNPIKSFRDTVLILLVVSFIYIQAPSSIKNQVNLSIERLQTIELIFSGDTSAGGTLIRISERAPKLIDSFLESTIIFGSAFSTHHFENQDYHLGYLNLLFNTGILGFLLFFLLFRKLILMSSKKFNNTKINKSLLILLFITLLLNNSTQMIGFNVLDINRIFLQAFIVVFTCIIYNYCVNKDQKLGLDNNPDD